MLREGLNIQTFLIGEGFDASEKSFASAEKGKRLGRQGTGDSLACGYQLKEPLTWGFHSPFMYWNCSAALLEHDADILTTINDQSLRKSFMNLTLRPASVFAGKTFVNSNITAADALVVTFFDLANPAAGAEWDERLQTLAKESATRHSWYLPDEEGSSHLYEFEFKPMTSNDALTLLLCYSVMIAYVLASLRRTRAVKSTLGLGLTIVIQLTVSIVASLTICGMLNIDLGLIPREVYPFVVFAIGLENMFRMMNAVVGLPATMPTVQRIATAMGEVGHLSLAAAGQNLFLLWVLFKLVAPSVQAFCAFAAIALVVDFFMHLSFFVAVLSVDVQRVELQDSLDRINMTSRRNKSPHRPERQTWYDALRQGKLPFSTRVAGTAVTLSFVLALNWHFFDNMSLLQMLQTMRPGRKKAGILFSSVRLPPVNARRSPGAWLRMQNQQTAEEMIQFVKPKVPSFVARIHQPVAVVLEGADRGGVTPRTETVLAIIHDVLDAHLIPFILTIVVIIALTTILMNYLLWNELSENDAFDGGDEEEEDMLHIGRLWRSHEHDITKIFTNGRLIVSMSSERLITATVWDAKRNMYAGRQIHAEAINPPFWPISTAAIDDAGTWLALYARDGRIGFCAIDEFHFRHVLQTPLQDRTPIISSFVPSHATEDGRPQYLLFTSDGYLTTFTVNQQTVSASSVLIVSTPPLSGSIVSVSKGQLRLCILTRDGQLTILNRQDQAWEPLLVTPGDRASGDLYSVTSSVLSKPTLNLVIIYLGTHLQILNDSAGQLVATLELTYSIKKGSLSVLHPPRRECSKCHGPATHALVFAFTEAETGDCVMLTYKLEGDASLLCFSPEDVRSKAGCSSIQLARGRIQSVENPGSWDAPGLQSIIGIRKALTTHDDDSAPESEGERATTTAADLSLAVKTGNTRVRSRNHSHSDTRSRGRHYGSFEPFAIGADTLEDWEIWTLSSGGELETRSLASSSIQLCQTPLFGHREHEQLYASNAGPVRKLGKRGVAVALANTIFVVTLGRERFQNIDGDESVGMHDGKMSLRTRGRDRDSTSNSNRRSND